MIDDVARLPPSADIELEASHGDWQQAALRLANESGEEVIVGFAAEPHEIFVDRRKARAAPAHAEFPGRHAGPVRWIDGRVRARILFDRSVIEIFANDGETVVTERVYPTSPLTRIEWVNGAARQRAKARMWTLRSVWNSSQRQP